MEKLALAFAAVAMFLTFYGLNRIDNAVDTGRPMVQGFEHRLTDQEAVINQLRERECLRSRKYPLPPKPGWC